MTFHGTQLIDQVDPLLSRLRIGYIVRQYPPESK